MDLRSMGFDIDIATALHELLDFADEAAPPGGSATAEKQRHHPSRAYLREAKAMARTAADVLEHPDWYEYVVDMPGVKPTEIKVEVDEGKVLVVTGERKRPEKEREEKEKEGVKYLKMERTSGRFLKKFILQENADTDRITATCQDGVLTVKVEKRPPPEPKKPKTIHVEVA